MYVATFFLLYLRPQSVQNMYPYRIISLFLFLGFIQANLYSQIEDTLSQLSIKELAQTGTVYLRENPRIATKYFDQIIKTGIETKDTTVMCIGYELKGEAYRVMGQLDTALTIIKKTIELLPSIDIPALEAETYFVLGSIYSDRGNTEEVMPSYFKAIKIAEENDLTFIKVNVEQGLAFFKSQIGKMDEAIADLERIKHQIPTLEVSETILKIFSYQNDILFSKVYWDNGQLDSTIFYSKKALEISDTRGDEFTKQLLYINLGTSYAQKGDIDKGLNYINLADSLGIKMGNDLTICPIRYHKAKIYFDEKDYQKTADILEKVVQTTEQKDLYYEERSDVYKLLAKSYKQLGQFEKANLYFEKYIQNYQFEKQQHEIVDESFRNKEIADFKKEMNQLQKEKNTQKNYLYYIGLGSLLVIIGLLLRIRLNKQKNRIRFEELISKIESMELANNPIINTKDGVLEEKNTTDVNQETTRQILTGLEKMEKSEYFLKQDCNAYNVSKKIKTNTSYLSKVVNAHFKKNFNTYINDLRINYALLRLKKDPTFRMYTIQSIANDLGYKSADSFSKYFKRRTGLLPSFYIKQLNLVEEH